jgi:hypothetical protein
MLNLPPKELRFARQRKVARQRLFETTFTLYTSGLKIAHEKRAYLRKEFGVQRHNANIFKPVFQAQSSIFSGDVFGFISTKSPSSLIEAREYLKKEPSFAFVRANKKKIVLLRGNLLKDLCVRIKQTKVDRFAQVSSETRPSSLVNRDAFSPLIVDDRRANSEELIQSISLINHVFREEQRISNISYAHQEIASLINERATKLN